MLPYLLALDLDYTACDRTRHLSQRTREALTAARAAGHTICFATGRRDIDMYQMHFLGREYLCRLPAAQQRRQAASRRGPGGAL